MQERTTNILLVEDDAPQREALVLLLESEGYHVVEAGHGREALAHLRTEETISLILLDLMMPVMDGWQFRAEQVRDPGLAAIPVIVISGAGSVAAKALAQGAAGYLRKPIDVDRLLDIVARHCRGGEHCG